VRESGGLVGYDTPILEVVDEEEIGDIVNPVGRLEAEPQARGTNERNRNKKSSHGHERGGLTQSLGNKTFRNVLGIDQDDLTLPNNDSDSSTGLIFKGKKTLSTNGDDVGFGLGAQRNNQFSGSYYFPDGNTDLLVPGLKASEDKTDRFGEEGIIKQRNERLDYFIKVANDLCQKVNTFN